jgi:hypothetical protein
MSYIERTARKLFPILNELKKRMIPEKRHKKSAVSSGQGLDESSDEMLIDLTSDPNPSPGVTKHQAIDLKNILGYLN